MTGVPPRGQTRRTLTIRGRSGPKPDVRSTAWVRQNACWSVSQPRRQTMKGNSLPTNETPARRAPWNKGKLIGAKPPLRPSHVWSIRTKLQMGAQTGSRAVQPGDRQQAARLRRSRHPCKLHADPRNSGVRIVYCLRSPSTVVAIFRASSYCFSSRCAFCCIVASTFWSTAASRSRIASLRSISCNATRLRFTPFLPRST